MGGSAGVMALGLDYGRRRIGLAKSDELGLTAQPLEVYRRRDRRTDLAYIAGLAGEIGADALVVGLPVNMDGSRGPAAREAEKFGRDLAALAGISVTFIDERLTTAAAERDLLSMNLSRERRRQVVDGAAAALILRTYLERTAR